MLSEVFRDALISNNIHERSQLGKFELLLAWKRKVILIEFFLIFAVFVDLILRAAFC